MKALEENGVVSGTISVRIKDRIDRCRAILFEPQNCAGQRNVGLQTYDLVVLPMEGPSRSRSSLDFRRHVAVESGREIMVRASGAHTMCGIDGGEPTRVRCMESYLSFRIP
jgi:hypothetical protein